MKTYEKLTAAFVKLASTTAWYGGNTKPSTHADPGYEAIDKARGAKTMKTPEMESATSTVNGDKTTQPDASGAMTRPVWYGNTGVVAGTGEGPQFTSGVSGQGLRA